MKIAVTADGPTIDSNVEEHFGRWPYYLFIDTDTMEFNAIPNPDFTLGGWSGPQSVKLMHDQGISTVLMGTCGPSALIALENAGIHAVPRMSGKAKDIVEQFKSGVLIQSPIPIVSDHLGIVKKI